MKFIVVISLLVTSGLTAPAEKDLRANGPKAEEGSTPMTVLLVVPDQAAFREESDELLKLSTEKEIPQPVSEERAAKNYPYEESYAAPGAYKPLKPAAVGSAVATFTTGVGPSSVPILLSCSPKVITGKLIDYKPPAYRSVLSDLTDLLGQTNPINDEFNLSDVLGLNSPASILSTDGEDERKRRESWTEGGTKMYKVPEESEETRPGNHHLVSEDYPQPNMIKLTPNKI